MSEADSLICQKQGAGSVGSRQSDPARIRKKDMYGFADSWYFLRRKIYWK